MLDIADDHTFLHMNLLYLALPYFTLLYPSLLHSTLPTGHAESYNPPKEYILTPDELAKMEDQDPKDRAYNFVPKTHDCLRRVSGTATALHYCAVLCCSPLPCNSVFRNLLFSTEDRSREFSLFSAPLYFLRLVCACRFPSYILIFSATAAS
jgi:hypothetical protein